MVVCGIVSQSVAVIVTYPGHSGNNWNIYANNQFQRPAEAMTKPIDTIAGSSSYSIPFGYNYPISGDYRATVNMITPSMSYEQSVENPGIDSTTYINYTPQRIQSNGHVYQHGDHSFLQPSVNIPSMSGQSYPSSNSLSTSQNSHIPLQESYYPSSKPVHEETSEPSYYSMSDSEQKTVQPSYYSSPSSVQEISQVRDTASIESSSYFPSKYGFTFQAAQLQTQYEPDSIEEPTLLSQHFEVTKPIAVPVYKKYPYAVNKRFPVAISHPVLVPVPHPYPGLIYLFLIKVHQKKNDLILYLS